MYVYIYIYIYVYIYIYTYIYIYIYTHTTTHPPTHTNIPRKAYLLAHTHIHTRHTCSTQTQHGASFSVLGEDYS